MFPDLFGVDNKHVFICNKYLGNKKVEEIIEEPKYESSASGIYAGPAVRKLAREFGIDLNKVIATGPRNRILKEDLHKFIDSTDIPIEDKQRLKNLKPSSYIGIATKLAKS